MISLEGVIFGVTVRIEDVLRVVFGDTVGDAEVDRMCDEVFARVVK